MTARSKAKPIQKEDVEGLRRWIHSLWQPVSTFFEGRYIWLAIIPIGIWLWLDRALVKTWLGLLLALVILAALALQLRKIVMPTDRYGKLEDYARKAQENPVAAALVFLGCVAYMVAIIAVGALWLAGLRG